MGLGFTSRFKYTLRYTCLRYTCKSQVEQVYLNVYLSLHSYKYFICYTCLSQVLRILQVQHLNVYGTERANLHIISHHYTLLKWFRVYRENDAFPNSSKLRSSKSKVPYFLYSHPDVAENIISFCKLNITSLSIEMVHDHIHQYIIPNLVILLKTERNDLSYDKSDLFKDWSVSE